MKLSDYTFMNKFESGPAGGKQIVLGFGDEYRLSIITGGSAYGNTEFPYEIAVFKNGEFHRMPGVIDEDDDVRGYMTETEVNGVIAKLYTVTQKIPEQI